MTSTDNIRAMFDKYDADTIGGFHNAMWQIVVNNDENGCRWSEHAFNHLMGRKFYDTDAECIVIASASGGYLQGCQFGYTGPDVDAFLADINQHILGHHPAVAEHIIQQSFANNKRNDPPSHRDTYPEQYEHELCGQTVQTNGGHVFSVYRVVNSRFGMLAMSEEDQKHSYPVTGLEVIG